jgi:hypothetical protein
MPLPDKSKTCCGRRSKLIQCEARTDDPESVGLAASVRDVLFQIVIKNEIKIGDKKDVFEVLEHITEHTNRRYLVKADSPLGRVSRKL